MTSEPAARVWSLLPYQSAWVRDAAQVKVCEKSRRIEISWAEAYDDVMHAAEGRGNTTYISYNKDMTAGWIADCADWARRLHGLAVQIDETEEIVDKEKIAVYSIRFPSGKQIEALSSAARGLRSRGRPGDRIVIDEAGFVDSVDALIRAAAAIIIWGGTIRIISTHNGADNAFNQLVADCRAGKLPYSLHTIRFNDAISDGLCARTFDVQRAAMLDVDPGADASEFDWSPEAEAVWEARIRASYRYDWEAAEELDCKPSTDDQRTWIRLEDYLAAEHDAAGIPENYAGGPVWIGYDVARRKHLAVLKALERVGDVLWLREQVVMEQTPFRVQREQLAELLGRYRTVRVLVDQTGMGEAQVEILQDRYRSLVEGVILSGDRRLSVATALRDAYEDKLIRVPRDRVLRADVRSIKRARSTGAGTRLESDGTETDGHADRFWAQALAVSGAAEGHVDYGLHRVDNHADLAGAPVLGRPGAARWRGQAGGLA